MVSYTCNTVLQSLKQEGHKLEDTEICSGSLSQKESGGSVVSFTIPNKAFKWHMRRCSTSYAIRICTLIRMVKVKIKTFIPCLWESRIIKLLWKKVGKFLWNLFQVIKIEHKPSSNVDTLSSNYILGPLICVYFMSGFIWVILASPKHSLQPRKALNWPS